MAENEGKPWTPRHIDTMGLEKGFDAADLIESGVTKEEFIAWIQERLVDGPPPIHVESVESVPKPKKPVIKEKPAVPQPIPTDNNVSALRQPEEEEYLSFPPEFTEDSLAMKFTDRYSDQMLYCGPWGKWLHWDGKQWKTDDTLLSLHYARTICREASNDILNRTELGDKRKKMAPAVTTRRTIANVEAIAKTDRQHVVIPSEFDSDPWVLNTPDGIVDLRTGQLRPVRRDDFVSKITAVGPRNKVPDIWLDYLKDATDGDAELEGYLKRVAGYCLTGSIAEHAFFFCYGTGGNGKGIYKEMLDWMLHSYARAANIDTFTDQRFTRHSSEIAYFQGARMVTSTEPPEGARWAEGRIKAMTGGDPITANHMHQNPFTFAPLFKLLFTGNFKPQLNSVDEAIRRRLYLIPFEYTVTAEKKDLDLPDKIREPEVAGGILHWMIEGCIEWQKTMLKPPKRVIYATSEYLESEDRIGRFLEENCEVDASQRVQSALLFARYGTWASLNNEYAVSKKRFNGLLQQKGFKAEKRAGEQIIIGLLLK